MARRSRLAPGPSSRPSGSRAPRHPRSGPSPRAPGTTRPSAHLGLLLRLARRLPPAKRLLAVVGEHHVAHRGPLRRGRHRDAFGRATTCPPGGRPATRRLRRARQPQVPAFGSQASIRWALCSSGITAATSDQPCSSMKNDVGSPHLVRVEDVRRGVEADRVVDVVALGVRADVRRCRLLDCHPDRQPAVAVRLVHLAQDGRLECRGGHQLAQKFSHTGLPRRSARRIGLPSRSVSWICVPSSRIAVSSGAS